MRVKERNFIMENKYNETVKNLSSALNSFSFNTKEFCMCMTREHKTLQQSFMRLCLAWIETCSSEAYDYDGRNEQSHKLAKAIRILLDGHSIDITLPLI
jgi:hypothetical protein